MARIITFYVPSNFHKPSRWVRTGTRARVIEFRPLVRPEKKPSDWRILGLNLGFPGQYRAPSR